MVPDFLDEGAPREWTRTTLGDLVCVSDAELKTGPFGTLLKAGEYTQEGAPVVSVGEIRAGRIEITEETPRVPEEVIVRLSDYVLQEGDIVLARKGGVERSALVTEKESGWFLGSDGIRLRLPAGFHPPFVAHHLQASQVQNWLTTHSTGSTMPSLSQKVLRDLTLPCPPLPEQRKIAAILSSVDDAIAATRKVIEQTKRVKQGLLQTLMTRGIGHTRFKKTESGEIPEAWEESVVEEQFDTQLGKMLNKKARTGPNQLPYLGNAQVQWTRVDLSDVSTMHFEDSERHKFSLRKGDLLVCEGGEIGRSALWMGEIDDCYFQKAIHRLRPRGWYVPAFFLRYMMFAAGTGRFAGYSAKTSISHLTQDKLRRMPIPVPPRSEQEEISAVFDAVDEEIQWHYAGARTMSSLKRGLMQDLLTGRVRVPLD